MSRGCSPASVIGLAGTKRDTRRSHCVPMPSDGCARKAAAQAQQQGGRARSANLLLAVRRSVSTRQDRRVDPWPSRARVCENSSVRSQRASVRSSTCRAPTFCAARTAARAMNAPSESALLSDNIDFPRSRLRGIVLRKSPPRQCTQMNLPGSPLSRVRDCAAARWESSGAIQRAGRLTSVGLAYLNKLGTKMSPAAASNTETPWQLRIHGGRSALDAPPVMSDAEMLHPAVIRCAVHGSPKSCRRAGLAVSRLWP